MGILINRGFNHWIAVSKLSYTITKDSLKHYALSHSPKRLASLTLIIVGTEVMYTANKRSKLSKFDIINDNLV
jgi:hypothetical protein